MHAGPSAYSHVCCSTISPSNDVFKLANASCQHWKSCSVDVSWTISVLEACQHDEQLVQHRTPVYMSPELIDSRHGLRGYDGKLVDVWASGVMLVAMLLGMFPFDHVDHPDPNTNEAQLEVWYALLLCSLM